MAALGAARDVVIAPGGRIQIEGVEKSFGVDGHLMPALMDATLEIQAGELLCLLGPSGCGKSTLLNIVAGFMPPTRGRVLVDGRPVTGPGRERGVVFQEYALFPWLTVAENIEFGPRLAGRPPAERRELVARYVTMVGLSEHRAKFPNQLSGGMRQRVAIARALANTPSIVLMDEPFGALDAQTREIMQDELSRIQRLEHKTIVFVTHSIREAVYLGDRVVVMTRAPGRIKEVFSVKLPETRDRFASEFTHYESEITQVLRDEVGVAHP